MMGKNYEGYSKSSKFIKLDSLYERRQKNALNFAKKSFKNENFSSFFPKHPEGHEEKEFRQVFGEQSTH